MTSHSAYPNHIILHLGAHKTATTLIQNWLCNNREQLLELGVGVGLPKDIIDSDFDRFCFQYSKPRPISVSEEQATQSLSKIWRESGCLDTLILSKENILGEAGRLYVNSFQVTKALRSIINSTNIIILFYIRRNDHFIESHILQQYAHGREVKVDAVLKSIGNRGWLPIVESMELSFPGNVRVEFYERIHHGITGYLEAFCRACNIDTSIVAKSHLPKIHHQNRSLSIAGLKLLKELWNSNRESDRISLYDAIQEKFNTENGLRPSLLPKAARRGIILKYRDENIRIIKQYANNDQDLLRFYRDVYN